MYKNKTLLITGGTGSFGSTVLDRMLKTNIKEIRIFSRDEKKQNDFFIENRHDQSIMSILTKLYGGIIIQNETYFTKDSSEQIDYPFLSVRNYGHGFRDRIKYQLNINKIKTTPIWF